MTFTQIDNDGMQVSREAGPLKSKATRAEQIVTCLGFPQDIHRRSPPLGNQLDPLDELFFIVVTTMTEHGAIACFERIKSSFPEWSDLLNDGAQQNLAALLRPCGLANQKSATIIGISKRLVADFGSVTLLPLKSWCAENVEPYLLSLPGVGVKVARCVMMYSLGHEVLPVDTHVLRLAKRLGLIAPELSWARAHDEVQAVVPPRLRYAMHVAFVTHGRKICTARNPRCHACPAADELCGWPTRRRREEVSGSERVLM